MNQLMKAVKAYIATRGSLGYSYGQYRLLCRRSFLTSKSDVLIMSPSHWLLSGLHKTQMCTRRLGSAVNLGPLFCPLPLRQRSPHRDSALEPSQPRT